MDDRQPGYFDISPIPSGGPWNKDGVPGSQSTFALVYPGGLGDAEGLDRVLRGIGERKGRPGVKARARALPSTPHYLYVRLG